MIPFLDIRAQYKTIAGGKGLRRSHRALRPREIEVTQGLSHWRVLQIVSINRATNLRESECVWGTGTNSSCELSF
jgi:hypothetical protein